MEIIIDRKWKASTYTIGKIYVNGKEFSDCIEDKDRGLKSTMTEQEIKNRKVYGETAIPTGTYQLIMSVSSKFCNRIWAKKYNGKVPELLNVKGYSGVRIHPGNTSKDTLGCILPGKNTQKGMVTQSTYYYYKLLDNYIVPTLKKGEKITVTIK